MSSDQPVEGKAAENAEQKATQKASRRRRWMVGSLIAAASLVLILSVLALWIRRVVLDSDGYNTTTTQLLQQPEIQQALARTWSTSSTRTSTSPPQIQPLLPKQAQPLAAPAAAALRDYADPQPRACWPPTAPSRRGSRRTRSHTRSWCWCWTAAVTA